jgi:integrase
MKKQLTNKRYKTLRSYPGVRKDLNTSKYLVSICVDKKRLSKSFGTLPEALKWRNTHELSSFSDFMDEPKAKTERFKDIWEQYKEEYLPTLEKSSQENRLLLAKFFDGLWDFELKEITPHVISRHVLAKKEVAIKLQTARRRTFDQELKLLKAIFNWYREEIDHTFANPVTRKHKVLGIVKKEAPKNKKMSSSELKLFLEALKGRPFWYNFALTQLLTAGRVQEIAGLQKRSLDFKQARLIIKDVAVWDKKTKKFDHLKNLPKNGEIREVHLGDELVRVLGKQVQIDSSNSQFVFHICGVPLTYRQIQYNYEWALEKAGLSDRFSGTHFLRHSMATLTRRVTGSLDSAQAVTGHKDSRLVQHYAHLDSEENKRAIVAVENFLNQEFFF